MEIKTQLFRDGTDQRNRLPRSLEPDYFSLDEQTFHDWITFVQSYARELTYFNLNDQPDGDWAAFFSGDVQQMVDYVEHPEKFSGRQIELGGLSQPHLVLFLTFLKLLRYPQQQFKDLTRRYLDFYYRDVLRLTEKAATPDQVHVIFALAPNETTHQLTQGTLLSAGPDSQGIDRYYALDEDISLNQAQVTSIKTVSVEKAYIDLKTIHLHYQRTNAGFEKVLRWAVGTPGQGDELPTFPNNAPTGTPVDIHTLNTLFQTIKNYTPDQITEADQLYILNQLCFVRVEDFQFCLGVHDREIRKQRGEPDNIPPTELEWNKAYGLIEKAYRKKINRDRRSRLRTEHRNPQYPDPEAAFLGMMQFALGHPSPGDALPPLPAAQDTLEQLLTAVNQPAPVPEAGRYVKEQLYMSVGDFQKIMGVQQAFSTNFAATDWDEVYRLVEKAQTKKQGFTYPPIGRTDVQTINAMTVADAQPGQVIHMQRFQPFLVSPNHTHNAQSLGVAITSPVLVLQEGDRTITLTIACQSTTFNRGILHELVASGDMPFAVAISSAAQWLTIPDKQLGFQVGDFILEEPLKSYRREESLVVYQATGDGPFNATADGGRYLRFQDGSLYQIVEVISNDQVRLRAVGQVASTDVIEKYQTLNLGGNFTELNNLQLSNDQQEITATGNRFRAEDIGKFILLEDGTVYQITQFANARRVGVRYWGYLPGDNTAKKYDRITFSAAPIARLGELEMRTIILANNAVFSPQDVGNVLVWYTGPVYRIVGLESDRQATVKLVGHIVQSPVRSTPIHQYSSSGIYLNSLQFTFTLDAAQPAIAAPRPNGAIAFATPDPVVKVTLKHSGTVNQEDQFTSYYQCFKDLCLEKVNIQVSVTNIQDLQLRSDRSVLSAQSPFEPFDTAPQAGTSFYFSNLEIIHKKLDRLSLHIQWMGLPEDFSIHYHAYSNCGLPNQPPTIDNNSFQTQLQLLLNRSWYPIATLPLFQTKVSSASSDTSRLDTQTTLNYGKADFLPIPDDNFRSLTTAGTSDDLFEQSRYFRLELLNPDFQHDLYFLVLNKVALAASDPIKSLTVYPPYTPKIKAISLDYEASVEINLDADQRNNTTGQVFQLHPFGYLNVATDAIAAQGNHYFLPHYDEEGALFIGIHNLHPPQTLTLLFQLVSGSARVDTANPEIRWSYLSGDRWQPFKDTEILSDNTNGLVDSGIIRFHIPEAATAQNYLLPNGLHWLKASVLENGSAIPDTLDIRTQAVKATFIDQGNAPDHLSKPLTSHSIQTLVQRDPAIQAVLQPYSSFRGRMRELDRAFYTRVSERLRHKQRALTRWDYERMVLEQFPQIYKVKCLTQAEQSNGPGLAQVTVIVIPDISNTAPFFPLEPKVPLYLLREIEDYLKAHTSPFVRLVVKNPRYEPIKYRIAVRFKSGYEQGHYLKQLNEDLIRFLSPWAYEEQADISFGSSIHSSVVIHFIETRPYVDYVANLKLIEQGAIAGDHQTGVTPTYQVNDTNLAQVKQVDSILVSAPEHIIDLITTEDYAVEEFEGINYMILGIDFIVS